MDSRRRQTSAKVKPKLKVTCGKCGKPLGNPLTHTCVTRTDFKQRKRRHEQQQKARPAPRPPGNAHDYLSCTDEHCSRYPCRVYKEGKSDGRTEGFDEGHAKGHAEGYDEGYRKGFPDGLASCTRPHQ